MLPSKDLFPALYNELNAYTYKLGSNGQLTFSAPNGMHDDCVMSLMLANEARKKGFTTSKIYISNTSKQKNYERI